MGVAILTANSLKVGWFHIAVPVHSSVPSTFYIRNMIDMRIRNDTVNLGYKEHLRTKRFCPLYPMSLITDEICLAINIGWSPSALQSSLVHWSTDMSLDGYFAPRKPMNFLCHHWRTFKIRRRNSEKHSLSIVSNARLRISGICYHPHFDTFTSSLKTYLFKLAYDWF